MSCFDLHIRHYPGDQSRPAIGLHCMMGSGGMFAPLAERINGAVDLYAFDFPGHGRSPDWSFDEKIDLHTDVTRWAARMISRPVDLIGHSFGATVALRIAVGVPEAIRSLTLIEPVLFAAASETARQAEQDRLAGFIEAEDWPGMLRRFLGDWGAAAPIPTEGPRAERLIRQVRMVVDTNAALMEDRAQILRENGLERIEAPVMFISGADSPSIVHEISDALADRLPDVARATIPGAGHMLPVTHPDQLADLTMVNLDRS
ncbi:alpha/beta fold hydrolase [Paracoccus sp. SCSIO 75233]|uniref:alpha/beta fold hydrolase n=1 Tax=Paracoccus sp. SCSIO 75233 TaxID=3017782 RepID=UPI0022F00667|nr:alpha/beta hydrolase [Paracoccus sp. SCSIO 75233]WBU54333.1 alpha/beta hydrolase [Paracoccus sp. SCSIO 75233]